jgi:hypothetical protein
MSDYAQLNGHYDFNHDPMVPPGTRIVVNEKSDQCAFWYPHGIDGYSMGSVLYQCRCYQVCTKKTRGTRVVDTVELFPSKTAMPQISSKDFTAISDLELSRALLNPVPAAPFSHIGTAQIQALCQLSVISAAALPQTATQHSSPVYQALSQFRNTIPHVYMPILGSPQLSIPSQAPTYLATPFQSPP